MNRQELVYFLAGCCQLKSKGPIMWLRMKKNLLTKEVISTIINLGRIVNKDFTKGDHRQLARDIINKNFIKRFK